MPPRSVSTGCCSRTSSWHTGQRPTLRASRGGRATRVSRSSGVTIGLSGQRRVPGVALHPVLGGEDAPGVLRFVQQVERAPVLLPPRARVGEQKQDVECGGVVFVYAQLVLVHVRSIRIRPNGEVALR